MPITFQDISVRPQVFIFSDDIYISNNLKKYLINSCEVGIVSYKSKLGNADEFIDYASFLKIANENFVSQRYLIFLIGVNSDLKERWKQISEILQMGKTSYKVLLVLPYNSFKSKEFQNLSSEILYDATVYSSVIYSGEIFDPVENIFNPLVKKGNLIIPKEEIEFYPLSSDSLAKFISDSIFSTKIFRKSTALLGKLVIKKELLDLINKNYRTIKIVNINEKLSRVESNNIVNVLEDQHILIDNFLVTLSESKSKNYQRFKIYFEFLASVLKSWFIKISDKLSKLKLNYKFNKPIKKEYKAKNVKSVFLNRGRSNRQKIAFPLLIIILILFTPLFLLLLSTFLLNSAGFMTYNGNYNLSLKLLNTSRILAVNSKSFSDFFISKRFLDQYYLKYYERAVLNENLVNVENRFLMIAETLTKPSNGSENDLNLEKINDVALELETLYNELGFIQTETEINQNKTVFRDPFFSSTTISEQRENVLRLSKFVKEMPFLLGYNETVDYLILLQDNTMLRPTGGKIRSFAIVSVANGKLIDTQVYDTHYADSKLSGEVDPPKILIDYFGKDGWLLEDSNWNNDFLISAEKIEWFLDKELDLQFDGVFALDFKAVDSIDNKLNLRTDLRQSDYKLLLSDFLNNLFESTQTEKRRLLFARNSIELFEKKHLLAAFHNENVKSTLSELGWDGSIHKKNCNDCYSDFVAITESAKDVGSDKIVRDSVLSVSIEENLVKRELTHFLENKNDFNYSFYLRFNLNSDAGVSPATVLTNDIEEQKTLDIYGFNDIKEAGLFVELLPKQTKAIKFGWESGVSNMAELKNYYLLIRKQPGLLNHTSEIKISDGGGVFMSPITTPSLTKEGLVIYNTNLDQDFLINLGLNKND